MGKRVKKKRVNRKKRVEKMREKQKNKGVFMLRREMLRMFLYKPASICTVVQRGMF